MENNIFETFNGSDLDRLIKCLVRVRSEGLTVDKYCHAGINQHSGNVYIWSEYWAGCVYCSPDCDVNWSYSCPDCGNEIDFGTERECREYAEKHDYKCESCNPESEGE